MAGALPRAVPFAATAGATPFVWHVTSAITFLARGAFVLPSMNASTAACPSDSVSMPAWNACNQSSFCGSSHTMSFKDLSSRAGWVPGPAWELALLGAGPLDFSYMMTIDCGHG